MKRSDFWGCFRILAPTTYIFFASAIPVISFGEQLERNTGKWGIQILYLVVLVSDFQYSRGEEELICLFWGIKTCVQMESSQQCRRWHPLPCAA